MDIKEESCTLDFYSENERDNKDLIKKFKIETVTSSSDIKQEVEESTCSENEERCILEFNETNMKESGTESKIHIKKEYCWLKSEDSCINDGIQEETHEDIFTTKPPSFCNQDVSSYTSHLFSIDNLGNNRSFNINKDGPECEGDRKGKSQNNVVTDISLQRLKAQKLNHDTIKPHKCNICSKGFAQSSGLKQHRLIHEGTKPHKCNICNKAFTYLSYLKSHKLSHGGIKPHKCNVCNKAFTKLSDLKRHQLIHEGIKLHKCSICNKAFADLSNLKGHELIHQEIKPHKCNICNKTFRQSSHLRTHKLIHEDVKQHKCNICNKTFTWSSDLKRHRFIHEGIKPHKCNVCKKAFTRLGGLKRHQLIHEGIKPV